MATDRETKAQAYSKPRRLWLYSRLVMMIMPTFRPEFSSSHSPTYLGTVITCTDSSADASQCFSSSGAFVNTQNLDIRKHYRGSDKSYRGTEMRAFSALSKTLITVRLRRVHGKPVSPRLPL